MALMNAGCDDVRVGNAENLWILWLVPGLVAFNVFVFRSKRKQLQLFASPDIVERLLSGVSLQRQYFKALMIVVAVLMCVLALARIKYGFTWEEVKRKGVDVVVALDVSDSMLVEDAESGGTLTRLERAKREITDLLRLMEGDRVALVAFAGTAFLECPLTLDYSAAELFLEAIDTDLIPVKGTAIGEALRVAVKAFEGSAHASKAVILITDGEDHQGALMAAAEKAKESGVRVFTIGIGRDEGAPIPDGRGGFRRDRQGELILSKLDERALQKVALITGGSYVRSVTGDVDLEKIYLQGIRASLEAQELGSKRRQRWEERFQIFLAAAIGLLLLEPWVRERRRRAKQPPVNATGEEKFHAA